MKLKRKLSILVLSGFIILFFGSFVFAENTITTQELDQLRKKAQKYDSQYLEQSEQYHEFKFQKDLINQVVSSNLTYLGIIIGALLSIVGFASGLFYFFNLKPFKDNLLKTEDNLLQTKEEILTIKEEIKNEISDLNIKISSDLDIQFKIANNSIMTLENKVNEKIDGKFNIAKEDYENKYHSVVSEVYRSMGMILERDNTYTSASLWFSRAACEGNKYMLNKSYNKSIDDILLGAVERNLNGILDEKDFIFLNDGVLDEIKENIDTLTDANYKDTINKIKTLIKSIEDKKDTTKQLL